MMGTSNDNTDEGDILLISEEAKDEVDASSMLPQTMVLADNNPAEQEPSAIVQMLLEVGSLDNSDNILATLLLKELTATTHGWKIRALMKTSTFFSLAALANSHRTKEMVKLSVVDGDEETMLVDHSPLTLESITSSEIGTKLATAEVVFGVVGYLTSRESTPKQAND